jgi:hypothetical protein
MYFEEHFARVLGRLINPLLPNMNLNGLNKEAIIGSLTTYIELKGMV